MSWFDARSGAAWRGPVPKFAGFRVNCSQVTFADTLLILLLTPAQFFRRQFLIDNGIRFFEGPRRLEDGPFVLEVYLKAQVISVLADYTCYYWVRRADTSNASSRKIIWVITTTTFVTRSTSWSVTPTPIPRPPLRTLVPRPGVGRVSARAWFVAMMTTAHDLIRALAARLCRRHSRRV